MERANRQEILAVFLFVQNGKIREILILVSGIPPNRNDKTPSSPGNRIFTGVRGFCR